MKNFIFLLLIMVVLSACEKRGDLPVLPSYATFKITSSSTDHYYEVSVGDSVLVDSLSGAVAVSQYVVTGKQRLKIRETGTEKYFIDSLIDVQRPGVEYALISLGADSNPLVLSAESLETTSPAEGYRKYSLLNIDTTAILKGRIVDVRFYDLSPEDGSFVKLGELKGITYMEPSAYVELKNPDAGSFFLEVADNATGEIIIPIDSYAGTMVYPPDENNAYLMKISNVGDDSWAYISADILLGLKL